MAHHQEKWLKRYCQRVGDIAEERGKALNALVNAGMDADLAKTQLDEALKRESQIAVRPLGIEGESEIQKTNRAWAALDTVVALLTTDWPGVNGDKPEPIEVALGLINYDETIQIRVAGTDPERIRNYADRMQAGDEFPPIELFFDWNGDTHEWKLWLVDGFHRYEALLKTMDYTASAIVYAGDREAALEHAATCNANHGLPLSNKDKQAAARRLLTLHPEWSNREIARKVGVSHPFVGKVRKAMEAEVEVSGNDYQMPEDRVVQRGDQTYTYTPPKQTDDRDPQYLEIWEIERDIRQYLNKAFGSAALDVSDDSAVTKEQRQYLVELRHDEGYDEIYEHLTEPYRKGDVVQAVNNVVEQLRQEIKRSREKAKARRKKAEARTALLSNPPQQAQVIRERLTSGDVEGFRDALQQDSLTERGPGLDIPEGFFCALQSIFGNEGSYVSPHQREKAVRCLYDALAGPTEAPTAEAEEAKKSTFTGDTCPDCGGRIIHVSANGKPARDVCMECGALTSSPP